MSKKEKKHFKRRAWNRTWFENTELSHSINDDNLNHIQNLETAIETTPARGFITLGGFLPAHTVFPTEHQQARQFYSQQEAIETHRNQVENLQQALAHKEQIRFELEHARKLAEEKTAYAIEYAALLEGKHKKEIAEMTRKMDFQLRAQKSALDQQAESKLAEAKLQVQKLQTEAFAKLQKAERELQQTREQNSHLTSEATQLKTELTAVFDTVEKLEERLLSEQNHRKLIETNTKKMLERYEELKKINASYVIHRKGTEDKMSDLSSYIQTLQLQKINLEKEAIAQSVELSNAKIRLQDIETNLQFEMNLRKKYEDKLNDDLDNAIQGEYPNDHKDLKLEDLISVEWAGGEEVDLHRDLNHKTATRKYRANLYSLS